MSNSLYRTDQNKALDPVIVLGISSDPAVQAIYKRALDNEITLLEAVELANKLEGEQDAQGN